MGIVLQSIATIFLGVGLALYYEWRLGLVVICFTPPILLAQYFFLRIARGETLNNQKALERSTKVSTVSGSVKLTFTYQWYLKTDKHLSLSLLNKEKSVSYCLVSMHMADTHTHTHTRMHVYVIPLLSSLIGKKAGPAELLN